MSKDRNSTTPSPAHPYPDDRPMTPEERAKRNRRFVDGVFTITLRDGTVIKPTPLAESGKRNRAEPRPKEAKQ